MPAARDIWGPKGWLGCGEWVCCPRYVTSRTCQCRALGAQAGLGGGRLEARLPLKTGRELSFLLCVPEERQRWGLMLLSGGFHKLPGFRPTRDFIVMQLCQPAEGVGRLALTGHFPGTVPSLAFTRNLKSLPPSLPLSLSSYSRGVKVGRNVYAISGDS